MKRTDLEKLKAKQLGNRLARERAQHRTGGSDGRDGRAATPTSELVGRMLRKILEPGKE